MSGFLLLLGGKQTFGELPENDAHDPFEISRRLAFLGSFANIAGMTIAVIAFANLWWRSS
jgi:ABC-type transport system involved in cytochrome c biogenesis permease subunit